MNKKCFNCELKEGIIYFSKNIYFCSKECEEIIWSNKEKNEFNKKLDNFIENNKKELLNVINEYNTALIYLKKILKMEKNYIENNIKDNNAISILEHALIFLKDADKEFKRIQNNSELTIKFYKNILDNDNSWNLTIIAFNEQLIEEIIKFRILIYIGLAHCYNFYKIFETNLKIIEYLNKNSKIYTNIGLNLKLKINDKKYIHMIEKSFIYMYNINSKIESTNVLLNLKKDNLI